MAHTLDDWELRQLLEDTLTDAWHTYLERRRGRNAKPQDREVSWQDAAHEAIDAAMQARWYDSTRPAVKE